MFTRIALQFILLLFVLKLSTLHAQLLPQNPGDSLMFQDVSSNKQDCIWITYSQSNTILKESLSQIDFHLFQKTDSAGVLWLWGIHYNGVEWQLETPVPILDPARKRQRVESTVSCIRKENGKNIEKAIFTVAFYIQGYDSGKTPMRNFDTAWVVDQTIVEKGQSDQQHSWVLKSWYVPGVGCVKRVIEASLVSKKTGQVQAQKLALLLQAAKTKGVWMDGNPVGRTIRE